jgi:hypothetical protein
VSSVAEYSRCEYLLSAVQNALDDVFRLLRVYAQTSFYQENLAFCCHYAQSRISLVFCCSLGFLVPWFSPLQLNKIWRIFCVMYGEEGGWTLIVSLQKLYLTDMFEWLLCYIQF